ncbi:hypothetical protein FGE12_12005 [Aggregicoccus sp. 17bor-14]|uniref:hypothetical protein n=1 Tax=Myxococcaceae TaxID=31 RepID=UPI00129C45A4|nr:MULTISPECIES: hypothetical protein [Myxococcaceae]MBF5043112.1 hypothetical protein [Simulacricoccus sp. 17bor-14]MRI88874.1 hypothetical protein [Aggregicoccus sp. 17bor-14]
MRTLKPLLVLLLLGAASCADTIIKTLGAENAVTVDSTPGQLRFTAQDLDNVHDEVSVPWVNPEGRAAVAHRSFVHHGQVVVSVFDAAGTQLYSTPADYNFDNQTRPGVPGLWTVRFQFFGARGRVDVGLSALPESEADDELIPPLPPQPQP